MTNNPDSNFFKEIMYWSAGIYVLYLVGSFIVGLFPDDAPRRNNSYQYRQPEQQYEQRTTTHKPHKSVFHRQTPYGTEEPLPSEVRPEDEDMYNWITDHPEYNGDWELWVEEYENIQQQGDEYDDEF
jgi:hypothetical protein